MSFLLPIATRVLGGAAAKGGVSRAASFSLGRMSSKDMDKAQDPVKPVDGINNYPKV